MRTRLSRLTSAVVVLCSLAGAPTALAQNVQTGGDATLTVQGFISVSFFAQNQNFAFGNGQNAEFPVPPEFTTDKWFLDGDVRSSRLTLALNGPEVKEGLRFAGALEMDFFGGFAGTGPFSDEQETPRLRLAYLDIIRGKTTIRLGQAWTPLFGNVPKSLSHVAFPLGYGAAGTIGWRFPGVYVYRILSDKDEKVTRKLTVAAFRGSWNGPGDNLNSGSAGNASFGPQVELRYDASGKTGSGSTWGAYLVGHWDQKDLSGADATAPGDSLDGTAFEFGAKYGQGRFSIQGNAYYGEAIGQQLGHITQFGDIAGWGAWFQPGIKLNKEWSWYLFYGVDDPDDSDIFLSDQSRLENEIMATSVEWSIGPYAIGAEWLHATLTSGTDKVETTGDQISVSAMYKF